MRAFTMLFLSHILADYYFQPQWLAERKARSIGWVLLHAAIYAATLGASLLLLGGGYIWAVVISAVTHCIIDVIKQVILNSKAKSGVLTIKGERAAFCIDQLLHIGIISVASIWVTSQYELTVPSFMGITNSIIGIDAYMLLSYAAIVLSVLKPTNVFVKRMLVTQKPTDNEKLEEQKRAGAYIGSLERVLSVILLALGQYAAIAIVFTAKSIARFRQLENREFAEYYLFGTLLSVVTACMVYGLVKLLGAV